MFTFYIIFVLFTSGIYLFFKGLKLFSFNFNLLDLEKYFNILNNLFPITIICIGTLFSSLVQSTAISISLLIPLVSSNKIKIKSAFYLIIGFNIGTVMSLYINGVGFIAWIFILTLIYLIFFIFYLIYKKHIFYLTYKLILGISFIFIGLLLLKTSFVVLSKTNYFIKLTLILSKSYILSFITGIILSAIIQSGSIICNTFQEIYMNSIINLDSVLLIIIGSNIGSTFIALFASFKFGKKTKLVAYFHIILNLIGSIIILTFFNQFRNILIYITKDKRIQISTSHLIYNLLAGLITLPLIKVLTNKIDEYI